MVSDSAVSGCVAAFVAFALALTATFAPAWISSGTRYIGFFGTCIEGKCESSTSLLTATAETKVSASFMIIGTFTLLIGSLVILYGIKKSASALKVGGVITGTGGVVVLIGALVFTKYWLTTELISQNTFCFGMAWVAGILGIGGGAFAKWNFF